jgi:hypothetical protein
MDREESSKELKVESGKLGFHDPRSGGELEGAEGGKWKTRVP